MTEKQLFIDILNLFKNQHSINRNQQYINNIADKKINLLIKLFDDLEKRVIILESKKNKKGKGQK